MCTFSPSVGVQGKGVSVTTHNDGDISYVFPNATKGTVGGIGDVAVIEASGSSRKMSIKLGRNALVIEVGFYTQPPDEAFLIQLAKKAVARL